MDCVIASAQSIQLLTCRLTTIFGLIPENASIYYHTFFEGGKVRIKAETHSV
jgi:hypothetical protein